MSRAEHLEQHEERRYHYDRSTCLICERRRRFCVERKSVATHTDSVCSVATLRFRASRVPMWPVDRRAACSNAPLEQHPFATPPTTTLHVVN